MPTTLSNISTEATVEENAPGVLTPILRFTPDDGLAFLVRNNVSKGEREGTPLAAKLLDSDGDPIAIESKIAFGYKAPEDDDFTVVSELRDDISAFRQLSLVQQRNEDFVDSTKIELDSEVVGIRENDELLILVESPDVVDLTVDGSRVSLDETAVREVSMDNYEQAARNELGQ